MTTLSDIVSNIAITEGLNRPKTEIDAVARSVFKMIARELASGNEVKIADFGNLTVTNRPARMGRNPATGQQIEIAASKAVKFKAAKKLKDLVSA